jgi:DNA end-binding protein Ku
MRSIWQGSLLVQKNVIGVKVYSAVVDRQIHFHLLHRSDRMRVQQRMVQAQTETPVPLAETRKAFEAEPGLYVAISSEELDQAAPEASREINVKRFVPTGAIDPQLFDRPYYLGPLADSAMDYFALTQALDRKQKSGIAFWVMRKHSYVGALITQWSHLMLITLRHAGEIIPASELESPDGPPLERKERELAGKLVETLAGDFHPEAYHDEYQARLRELVDAKRAGKKLKPKRAPKRRREGSLADSLLASLNGASKKRYRRSGKSETSSVHPWHVAPHENRQNARNRARGTHRFMPSGRVR